MKRTARFLLSCALALMLFGATAVQAQTYRSATPAAPSLTEYGSAVAVGEDAVFVGQPQNRYQSGIVYVYRQEGGTWSEAAQLTASEAVPNDQFGGALAVGGGTLLVGGAPLQEDAETRRGAVYVFEQGEGGTWAEAGQLSVQDTAYAASFGGALALEDDLALVGAPNAEGGPGAVFVFRRGADGTWAQEGMLESDTAQAGFGARVAIAGDQVLVGAPGANGGAGAVHAYAWQDGTWTQQRTLTGNAGGQESNFGASIAVRDSLLLVGAPRFSQIGAVHVFQYEDGVWSEGGMLLPYDGEERHLFGAALALGDGQAWVGAPGAAGFGGRIYLFDWQQGDEQAGTWQDAGWTGVSKLAVEDVQPRSLFGGAVSVRGGVAAVGMPGDDYGAGGAATFAREGDEWTAQSSFEGERDELAAATGERVPCQEGVAGARFDCSNVAMLSFLPISEIGGERGINLNDIWGWTDPQTGTEYALVGRTDGTAFVDISDPSNPVYVGSLPRTEGAPTSSWRDIKVYEDHAFIVADPAEEHGMQVFDLTRLRDYDGEPATFEPDVLYDEIHSAHNIVINEETGFAYAVGASGGGTTCGGGLHMINIQDPLNPTFAGCFADESTGRRGTGYSHDAQCIVYDGPDEEYQGREICFGSNETALSVADVTDKENPVAISTAEYPAVAYTHQGWVTDDHRYIYVNDELDELSGSADSTRTLIWDITDLDDPQLIDEYTFGQTSSDHNLYIEEGLMYQSNYASGLRVHDVSDPENPREVGYFDTTPTGSNGPGFTGTWSNYPYFESGVIVVSSIGEGLFLLQRQEDVSL